MHLFMYLMQLTYSIMVYFVSFISKDNKFSHVYVQITLLLLDPSWLHLYINLFFLWWSFSDKVSKCLTVLKISLCTYVRKFTFYILSICRYIFQCLFKDICKSNCNHPSGTQHKWQKCPWSNIKMSITLF